MKFRGQAFETMMLVISVIVALAILGALLGILGGIGGIGSGESKTAIRDLLKTIEQRGVGIETKEKVDFNPGSILPEELVVGTSIQTAQLKVYCESESIICGQNGPVTVEDGANDYIILRKSSGTISVAKSSSASEYHICIGDKERTSAIVDFCKGKLGS